MKGLAGRYKLKLHGKFVLAFLSTLFVVFTALMICIQIGVESRLGRYIEDNIFSMQGNIDDSVTSVVDECAYLYARILRGDNVPELNTLAAEDASEAEKSEAFSLLMKSASVNEHYFSDVKAEYDGDVYSMSGDESLDFDLRDAAQTKKNSLVLGDCRKKKITIAIGVKDTGTVFSGTFFFYMDEKAVGNVCNVFEDNTGYSFILRSDGYILSHADTSYIGKSVVYSDLYDLDEVPSYKIQKVDGVKSIVVISGMDSFNSRYGFGCYLVSVLDYDSFYREVTRMNLILCSLAAILFVLAVFVAVGQAKGLAAPIAKLTESIAAGKKTQTDADGKETGSPPRKSGGDEIEELGRKYDEMLDRIFHLMEKEKQDMETQRKLELDALQMQINPHFLYNTLDVIAWMAKIKKQSDIESLVMNLAGFFRLSLHHGDRFICVAEEVELVRHYLEIDKICYPDRVTAEFDVSRSVGGFKTLKLVLQPVIENALKYAFPEGNGYLKISAYEDGSDVVFVVADNGVGFEVSENMLEKKPEDGAGRGFGLYNVNRRVRLEYGEGYGLCISSKPGYGTRVTIRIAKRIGEGGAPKVSLPEAEGEESGGAWKEKKENC